MACGGKPVIMMRLLDAALWLFGHRNGLLCGSPARHVPPACHVDGKVAEVAGFMAIDSQPSLTLQVGALGFMLLGRADTFLLQCH